MPAEVADVSGQRPPPVALERGLAVLAAGAVLGVPTDTVYGLAANPFLPGATEALFAVKGRPRSVELPVLVADQAQAATLGGVLPVAARALMDLFWPGALTIVVARRRNVGLHLGGDDGTVGLSCPAQPVPLALLRRGGPMATNSDNAHGGEPATTAAEVARLPGVTLVLDAGRCPARPSTVVDCTTDRTVLLREGTIPWSEIEAACGPLAPRRP
ncbi:MAG: L-threonylcarbamoyladenylate synthase [Actinomycetota bacterium]|nr:L-threonylcarbamoyladenylate synthase [Actinomycetota bacterium]